LTLFPRPALLRVLAGGLRFYFLPESFMRNALARAKALPGGLQDGLQLGRVSHEQTFQVFFIPRGYQDRNRFAIPGDDDRVLFDGLQISAEVRLDVCHGNNLHSSTSSPPTISRFLSLMPMAWICTSRSS